MTATHRASGTSRKSAVALERERLAKTQLDLFPVKPVIDLLDPRGMDGPKAEAEHAFRVRLRPDDAPHFVFHDRYGWYCDMHGAECAAVPLAREELKHADD